MPAAQPMRELHDRQPVVLDPDVYDAWLDPETPAADAKQLLQENLDGDLQFHRVCRDVNASITKDKQRNDMPHFIDPIEPFPNPL
jgi:putative SOS response-associated peptidase YedK